MTGLHPRDVWAAHTPNLCCAAAWPQRPRTGLRSRAQMLEASRVPAWWAAGAARARCGRARSRPATQSQGPGCAASPRRAPRPAQASLASGPSRACWARVPARDQGVDGCSLCWGVIEMLEAAIVTDNMWPGVHTAGHLHGGRIAQRGPAQEHGVVGHPLHQETDQDGTASRRPSHNA